MSKLHGPRPIQNAMLLIDTHSCRLMHVEDDSVPTGLHKRAARGHCVFSDSAFRRKKVLGLLCVQFY
jgi:hypothetical protein